jgi:DNA-binding transcriptional MerR regulator
MNSLNSWIDTEKAEPAVGPVDASANDSAMHRSGAVARMLRMPVATLRVWERRYGLTQPALSPSGQRLYTAEDVRRLGLIRQLTDRGHAIGVLAPLDMQALLQVAETHEQALAGALPPKAADAKGLPSRRSWRLAVIGAALGSRLQRPSLIRRLGPSVILLGPFDDMAQAAASLQPDDVDALLLQESHLHAQWSSGIAKAAPALATLPKAVLYSFATDPVCDTLSLNGTRLLREPQPDAVLAQWLHGMAAPTVSLPGGTLNDAMSADEPTARRWDDAALADFAGRLNTVACECPRHMAELLMQLSHFETYSAECEHRSPADAELHGYLRRVTAGARARFEMALEQVARHEGLMLPSEP